jgi:hypothetical protein
MTSPTVVAASSSESRRTTSRWLALADRLFGGAEPILDPPRRWLLRYLGVAAMLATIIVARRPDAVTNPQFWAEDGYIFFYENLTLGFPRALAKMFFGFPYLAQRLIAFAGGLVPLAAAPRVYTTSAIAITALALATFALPGFRHLVRSDALRVLFGIAAVSAPFDREVLSNPTNLGWFIGIWLSLLSVMHLPRKPWRVALLGLLGSAAVFATPLASVNLPLWVLRAWRGVRWSDRAEAGFAITLFAAFAVLVLLTGNLGAEPVAWKGTEGYSLLQQPFVYLRKYACVLSYRAAVLGLPPPLMDRVDAAGNLAVAGITGLLLAALIAASAAGRYRSLPGLLLAIGFFAGSFLLLMIGRPKYYAFLPCDRLNFRYTIYPAAMFSLAVVTALDGLPRGRLRILAGTGVLILLVSAWSTQFVVPPFIDHEWPVWAVRLERKLATRSMAALSIPMNPPWTPLLFDPANRFPDVDIPPQTIVASLGTDGMFGQSFVSRCDNLMTVEMRLSAGASSDQGALTFSLVDFSSGQVVATTTIPRGEMKLDKDWQPFHFGPIQGSAGRKYAIVLRAVQNDYDASLWVLGSREDRYPEGEAVLIGQALAGDASFRYDCQKPAESAAR